MMCVCVCGFKTVHILYRLSPCLVLELLNFRIYEFLILLYNIKFLHKETDPISIYIHNLCEHSNIFCYQTLVFVYGKKWDLNVVLICISLCWLLLYAHRLFQ